MCLPCPLIDDKLRHNIVKVAVKSQAAVLAFDWLIKKVNKISSVKKLTVWQLKVELKLAEINFFPVCTLIDNKDEPSSARELDSHCKNIF